MGIGKVEAEQKRVCPICRKTYTEHPALSRVDNETLVCPDCGVVESLESLGISKEKQEKILETIHKCMVRSGI